jgi:pheromone shutdown protein TraB
LKILIVKVCFVQVLIDERNEWMASYIWLQCDCRAALAPRDTVFVIAGT